MAWKINHDKRCPTCYMRKDLCLCSELPQLKTKTRLTLLMHHREVKSFSNTGRLAVLALKNSCHILRGRPDQNYTFEDLCPEGYQPLLLYPSKDSVVLTPELVSGFKKPVSLIVPDGNWRQAAKIPLRENLLKNVLRVRLDLAKPSQYLLRREPKAEGMATIEAIARTMGYLEGAEIQKSLEEIFLKMNYRVYWSRGKMSKEAAMPYLPAALRT